MIEKNNRRPLDQQAYDHLLKNILSGKLESSTQLDERTLSEEIGISRTPIRSAISQLTRQGLVEYFPYRGNFVRNWTIDEVNDLFEVRISLETLAVRLAIPKLSDEDIAHIEGILNDMDDALVQGDLEQFGQADAIFHRTISEKTRNRTLIETLERLNLQIHMIRTLANRNSRLVENTVMERTDILEALKSRDIPAAVALMQAHIEGVREAVLEQLRAHG